MIAQTAETTEMTFMHKSYPGGASVHDMRSKGWSNTNQAAQANLHVTSSTRTRSLVHTSSLILTALSLLDNHDRVLKVPTMMSLTF